MSKRTKNMVVVAVLLIVLVGAYFIIDYINKSKVDTEEPTGTEVITVIDKASSDLISFSFVTDNYKMNFEKDEEGNWHYSDPRLEIPSSSIISIASSMSYLSARRIVTEDPTDLSEFGLSEPTVIATGIFPEGETIKLLIGDLSPVGDIYYAMIDGTNTVYAIAKYSGENFMKTVNDLMSKQLVSINIEQGDVLNYFYLKAKDKDVVEIVLDYEGDELMEYGMSGYIVIQPYEKKYGTSENFLNIYGVGLLNLSIKDFVTYVEDENELSQFGFDAPSMEIKAVTEPSADTQEVKTLHLIFGDMANDTDIYFKNVGDSFVYTMDRSLLNEYFDYNPFNFLNRFITLLNIQKIDSATIATHGDESWELKTDIVHTTNKDDDGNEEVVQTFFFNGNQIDDSEYRSYYQMLIGLLGDTVLKESEIPPIGTEPEITIIYELSDLDEMRVVNLVSINDSFYAVGVNGEYTFAINKRSVDAAISHAKEIEHQYE